MKKYIEAFIVWLESVSTDPVIKFLILCIAALIAVGAIAIVINTLKGLFLAIFGRKRKNKLPKMPEVPVESDGETEAVHTEEVEVKPDTRLEEAQSLVDTLKQTMQTPLPPDPHIPEPISIKDGRLPYSMELIDESDYQLTAEETSGIAEALLDKNLSELSQQATVVDAELQKAVNKADADKQRLVALIEQQSALFNAEKLAIDTYNQEQAKATEEWNAAEKAKNKELVDLSMVKNALSKLIEEETETAALLKHIQEQVVVKTNEAQNLIVSLKENGGDTAVNFKDMLDVLAVFKQQAEDSTRMADENDAAIASLIEEIKNNHRILAIGRANQMAIGSKIEQLEAEEAKRLAEQQAREEAERKAREEAEKKAAEEAAAKAKAEAEAKARAEAEAKAKAEEEAKAQAEAEARAKAEAEQKAREEAERKAAEEARLREEERIAAEKAEELRKLEELRLAEEKAREEKKDPLNNGTTSDQSASQQSSEKQETSEGSEEILSAEDEVAQARKALEAQRERRRQEALKKLNKTETVEEKASEAPKAPKPEGEPVPTIETTPTAQPEAELENSKPEKAPEPVEDFEDPMAKIRAEWAREKEAQEALKAGDVDGALNAMNKNKTNK